MNTQECDILNLILSNTYTNQRTLAEDSGHSLGIVNRSIKTLIAEGYLDESIQPTLKALRAFPAKGDHPCGRIWDADGSDQYRSTKGAS